MHHLVPTLHGDEEAPEGTIEPEIVDGERSHEGLGAGDSRYVHDLLSPDEIAHAIARLSPGGELPYQQWYHMPDPKRTKQPLRPLRRIKVALATGPDSDGFVPHYRFPVNDQCRYGVIAPMTETVEALRRKVEALTGEHFNHAVALVYRDGEDSIGFHKDKVLDLDPEAPIATISLGAARPLALRDDIFRPTREQRIVLAQGSLYLIGPKTNRELYHAIPRVVSGLGPRISVTFRRACTFRRADGAIRGQGERYTSGNWPVELKGCHRLHGEALPLSPQDHDISGG